MNASTLSSLLTMAVFLLVLLFARIFNIIKTSKCIRERRTNGCCRPKSVKRRHFTPNKNSSVTTGGKRDSLESGNKCRLTVIGGTEGSIHATYQNE